MVSPHPMASFVQLIMAQRDEIARQRRPGPKAPAPAPAPEPAPAPARESVPDPGPAPARQPVLPRQIDLDRARRIRA
jgi:hypothetical protein